jgi:hypothetical protein
MKENKEERDVIRESLVFWNPEAVSAKPELESLRYWSFAVPDRKQHSSADPVVYQSLPTWNLIVVVLTHMILFTFYLL